MKSCHIKFLCGFLALALIAPSSIFISEIVVVHWTGYGMFLRATLTALLFTLVLVVFMSFQKNERDFIAWLSSTLFSVVVPFFFFVFGAGFWLNLPTGNTDYVSMRVDSIYGRKRNHPEACTVYGEIQSFSSNPSQLHLGITSAPMNQNLCRAANDAKKNSSALPITLNRNLFGTFVDTWH